MTEKKSLETFIEDGMEYNTDRRVIKLTQYGRNIQKLVNYAIKLEDREERNRAANQIVQAMEVLNPKIKQIDNYKEVLWSHLAMMSDFKLDVDYPYEVVTEEIISSPPESIPLGATRMKKRQYGRVIENLIDKALDVEDPEIQSDFIEIILFQMKRIYVNWNKDVVNDEVIFEDFRKMSNNKLKVPEDFKLPQSYEIKKRVVKNTNNNNNNNRNNNNRNKYNNNNNKNRQRQV